MKEKKIKHCAEVHKACFSSWFLLNKLNLFKCISVRLFNTDDEHGFVHLIFAI